MRHLLAFIALVMLSTFASGQIQYLGSPTTTVRNRGNFVSDSLFYLPKRQKLPSDTGAIRYAIADSSVYVWSGSQWTKLGASIDTLLVSTRAWRQKGDDSLGALIALKVNISDTATMLSPYVRIAGVGLTKATQTLSADTVTLATRVRVQKAVDSLGSVKQNTLTNPVTGTGTTNRVAKFTGTSTIGNGSIVDSASAVSMTITPLGAVGIGKQPNQWASFIKVLHVQNTTLTGFSSGSNHIGNVGINYWDNGTSTYYQNDGFSSIMQQQSGDFRYFTAPSGTAGNAITFTERMRLTAAGRLLVGTTTEGTNTVDIAGNLRTTTGAVIGSTSGNLGVRVTPGSWSASTNAIQMAENAFVVGQGNFSYFGHNYINDGADKYITANPSALMEASGGKFVFYTSAIGTAGGAWAGTEKMRITQAGNVGIGTNSPSEVLHVVGRGRFTTIDSTSSPINVLTSDVNGVIRKTAPGVSGSGTANRVAKFTGASAIGDGGIVDERTTEAMRITSAGDVGIGTSTPVSLGAGYTILTVNGTTGGILTMRNNNVTFHELYTNGNDVRYEIPVTSNWVYRASNGTERMRLTSSGELLINTTTDVGDYRLQVNGNANFRDDVLIDTNLRVNRHIALDQTLSAWSLGNAVQGPQGATLFLAAGGVQSLANIYYDGAYKYTTSNPGAAMFLLQSGITFATYGSGTANGSLTGANEMVYAGGELRVGLADQGTFKLQVADKSYFGDEVQIASTTDLGNYKLQVTGDAILTGSITTGAPTSGTAAAWKLGTKVATSVQLDTGNYIEVEVGGTFYRLAIVTPL